MMKKILLLAALLCAPLAAHAAEETHNLTFAGHDRPYIVHTPPGYNTDLSHPVIIAMHGGGGNPEQFMHDSGLNDAADRAGMIVVYPSGYPGAKLERLRTWNAGECCAGAKDAKSDDVGYIRAVLDDLPGYYNIDKRRIYATGHSNGGMMSYRLACEMADRFAAIAPSAGQDVTISCTPSRAIPVLHIHGTEDRCATYNGGQCGGCFAAAVGGDPDAMRWPCDSVPDSLAARAKLYGCTATPETVSSTAPVTCQRWSGCRDNATVTLCSIAGQGHSWAGGTGLRICEKRPNLAFCQNKESRSGPKVDNVSTAAMIGDFFMSVK